MKQKAEKEEKDFFSAGMVWLFSYQVLQHESLCENWLPLIALLGFTAIIEESLLKKKAGVQ